jgi:hypothetical protein
MFKTETYTINYEGINYECYCEITEADETTGYKGTITILNVSINGHTIINHLQEWVVDKLTSLVSESL